jgi:predicted RNA binding protein YcfA (HicA-like mRNA interferase family)
MSKIPTIKPKKLLKMLQKQGFFIHHQKGSHIILKSVKNPKLRVTLPMHNKDLKRKTLLSILKQAEVIIEEL